MSRISPQLSNKGHRYTEPLIIKSFVVKSFTIEPNIIKSFPVEPHIIKPFTIKPHIIKSFVLNPLIRKPLIVKPFTVKPHIIKPLEIERFTMKALRSLNLPAQRSNMFTRHSIFTGTFIQPYVRNYCSPSCNPSWQTLRTSSHTKTSAAAPETREFEDGSNITDRNHAYYEKYSIAGFDPIVYTLPKQAKSTEKTATAGTMKEKIVTEYLCHIITRNHRYFQEFSIPGFKSIKTAPPKDPKPAEKSANTKVQMGRYHVLIRAASYATSSSPQKTMTTQEYMGNDHDIDTRVPTIEELGFESLGITGFQGDRDDTGENEGEMEAEDGKDEKPVQFREGGEDPIRAEFPPICLFMGIF